MKYPNAYEGIKRIYRAEILEIVALVLTVAASVLPTFLTEGSSEANVGIVTAAGGFLIAMMVVSVIAFFLNISGISRASADEPEFKKAMIYTIGGIAAGLLANVFEEGSIGVRLLEVVQSTARMFTMLAVINGIMALAKKLMNREEAARGKRAENLLFLVVGLSLILQLISVFLKESESLMMVGGLLGIVAMILMIAAICTYLKLLSRARKMLK